MKLRNVVFTAVAAASLLMFSVSAPAQAGGSKATRVQFAKGSSTAVLAGKITGKSNSYVLSARKGQSVEIKITKVSGPGSPSIEIGTVPRGTTANVADVYRPVYRDTNLTDYTYVVDSDRDVAIWVNAKPGTSYKLTIAIPSAATSSAANVKQKTKPASKTAQTGKKPPSGDVFKNVKIDPITKSAMVSGITVDPEKPGAVYYMVDLLKGQKLLITANPADISISAFMEDSGDAANGRFLLEAFENSTYQIEARSETPGKKYTLTFKLQ